MIKSDVITAVSNRTGISKRTVSTVVNSLLESVVESVGIGESVKFSGFGNFELVQRKARKGRNAVTNEVIHIPVRNTIVFKPSKTLKKRIEELE